MRQSKNPNCVIPHLLTSLRFMFSILFIYSYFLELLFLSISIFTFAIITDILDGVIARRLDSCSRFGGYFDVSADFFLIGCAFVVFIIKGIYPYWLLILIGFMFIQFILSSRFKKLIYDPIGKYIFLFLIIVVFMTFISDSPILCIVNCVAFVGFCTISLISRYVSLSGSLKNIKKID